MKPAPAQLKRIGGPPAGTVSAIAVSDEGPVCEIFIGTKVGIYFSVARTVAKAQQWQRLAQAPLGIMALALSPNFGADHRLVAGTDTGIYVSTDAGAHWHAAQVPIADAMVLALCFSPAFADDHVMLAGTLEDGIWYSEDCGEHWVARSFGVLDATVFALAFSPNFAHDQTVFAGTDTAIYYSYNGARAWKQLDFPEACAPVLSLALVDHRLLAGTEQHGLYRADADGTTWHGLSLPAKNINALLTHAKHGVVAATETGVWQSQDGGESWSWRYEIPDVISLAAAQDRLIAGCVDQGAWQMQRQGRWRTLGIPPSRSLSGLVLFQDFEHDQCAFMYGLQEGLWRSNNRGKTWVNLNENLPSADVHALVLSPAFAKDHLLLAALTEGLWISHDSGEHWQIVTPEAADLLVFSQDGVWLAAAFVEAGLRISRDLGQTWTSILGPWDSSGKVIGLAIDSSQQLHIALLEGTDNMLSLWHGSVDGSDFQNVLREPAPDNPVVDFWLPDAATEHPFWYVSCGESVWAISKQSQVHPVRSVVISQEQPVEHIIALTGLRNLDGELTLYTCSNKRLFVAQLACGFDPQWIHWQSVCDYGDEAALAFGVSHSKATYVMLLGGTLCEMSLTLRPDVGA